MMKDKATVLTKKRVKMELKKRNLILGPRIGNGLFSVVYKVYDSKGEVYGACKISRFERSADKRILNADELVYDNEHCLKKEKTLLKLLIASPHIITIKGDMSEFDVASHRYGYIITEPLLCLNKPDAKEILAMWKEKYGELLTAAYIGYCIVAALKEAKDTLGVDFAHRDIRMANIFLALTNDLCLYREIVKLGDLGLSNYNEHDLTFPLGVRGYDITRAPEKIQTSKSDIYSIGCILNIILNIKFNSRAHGDRSFGEYGDFGDFLKSMVSDNPDARPDIDTAYNFFDSYIRKFEKEIDKDRERVQTALKKLSSGLCLSPSEMDRFSNDSFRIKHLEGINSFISNDFSSSESHWMATSDSYSRYYLASLLLLEGDKKQSLKLLSELQITPMHPLFDYIAALFSFNGEKMYDGDGNAVEYIDVAANAALDRDTVQMW